MSTCIYLLSPKALLKWLKENVFKGQNHNSAKNDKEFNQQIFNVDKFVMSGNPWVQMDREATAAKTFVQHTKEEYSSQGAPWRSSRPTEAKHNESERPMEATIRAIKLITAFRTAGLVGPSPSPAYTEQLAEQLLLPGSSSDNGSQRKKVASLGRIPSVSLEPWERGEINPFLL